MKSAQIIDFSMTDVAVLDPKSLRQVNKLINCKPISLMSWNYKERAITSMKRPINKSKRISLRTMECKATKKDFASTLEPITHKCFNFVSI